MITATRTAHKVLLAPAAATVLLLPYERRRLLDHTYYCGKMSNKIRGACPHPMRATPTTLSAREMHRERSERRPAPRKEPYTTTLLPTYTDIILLVYKLLRRRGLCFDDQGDKRWGRRDGDEGKGRGRCDGGRERARHQRAPALLAGTTNG
ncbi:hypothetical protein GY45DRAFT_79355 [Cubamyces sp. BRFM 1775]|nr:hypothetical protein GY45DRAFT_79355 [Cubamyces sp. BRFM 1775]